ncbi:MAG: hypothetical protein LBL87_04355 [Ruminococcus sp.]|nr:hypothetical protein [Ruminococcus sp.]
MEKLLGKLIKFDFKTQWFWYAAVFVFALIITAMVFFLAPENKESSYVIRSVASVLIPSATYILTVILGATHFSENISGNGSYFLLSVPAKISSQIAAKTIVFCLWFAGAFAVSQICISIINTNFITVVSTDLFTLFRDRVNVLTQRGGINGAVNLITECINIAAIPLLLFGFITAAVAFGHLFGARRKLGKTIFIISFVILFTALSFAYGYCREATFHQFYKISGDRYTLLLLMIFNILGSVILIAVTAALYRFTHYVFTKRVNVI